MKKQTLSLLKFVIGWPLSIVAIVFLGKIALSEFSQIKNQILDINLAQLILSIFCFLVYYFLRGYFWQKLLEERGHKLSLATSTYFWGMSELKRFIPGNLWTFLGRTSAFAKQGVSVKTTLSLLAIELQFLTIGSIGASVFAIPYISSFYKPYNFSILLSVLSIITIAIFLFHSSFYSKHLSFIASFKPSTMIKFLLLSIIFLVFFGLGTFFSISAIFPLSFGTILFMGSFFVFSFLVGFLSFITPMGIGVRETVISFGLLPFLSFSQATFAALFARFILVIAEMLFLAVSYVWVKKVH